MDKQQRNPNQSIFWIIWSAIFSGLFIYQFQLGGGMPQGSNEGTPPFFPMALSISVIAAATLIRWIVMPRVRKRGKLLVLMILGLALAESAQFFQLFLVGSEYPETQLQLFILSLLGAGQFVPFYAAKALE